jgi:DNA-directed RNA polymerase omega subunit
MLAKHQVVGSSPISRSKENNRYDFTTKGNSMTTESRARYSSEEAVQMVGNRFDLVLIASARIKELRKGHLPKVKTNNGPGVTALMEIEKGFVGREYLRKVGSR